MQPLSLSKLPPAFMTFEEDDPPPRIFVDPHAPRVSIAVEQKISVWDLVTRRCLCEREHKGPAFVKAWFRDGMDKIILFCEGRKSIELLHAETAKRAFFLKGPGSPIYEIALSPCGYIVAAVDQSCLWLWHIDSPEPIEMIGLLTPAFQSGMTTFQFSPCGRFLLFCSGQAYDAIHIWDLTARQFVRVPFINKAFYDRPGYVFTEDGQYFYIATKDASVSQEGHVARDEGDVWRVSLEDGVCTTLFSPPEHTFGWDYWFCRYSGDFQPRQSGFGVIFGKDGRSLRLSSLVQWASFSGDRGFFLFRDDRALYAIEPSDLFANYAIEGHDDASLRGIADRLRMGFLEIDDAVDLLEAHELLVRWFAIETAMHGSLQAKGGAPVAISHCGAREILQICRRFALGSVSDDDQEKARQLSKDLNVRGSGLLGGAFYVAIGARRVKNAVKRTSNYASDKWRRHRLAFLCELWALCGERSPWLLWEGKCPIDVPVEASLDTSVFASPVL